MNYTKIRQNAKQFLLLTSLTVEEFDDLLPRFSMLWDRFIHKFTLAGTHDQQEVYSGKKKAHTMKNFLLCCTCGFVLFLGHTVSGKTFDKKVAQQQLSFKKRITMLGDLGFQGLKLTNGTVILPHKKPKFKELSKIQKKENQLLSRERVLIENVLAHVKIMRIVKDKNRNLKNGFRDLVIDTAVRLHNYRVTKRRIVLLSESFKST